MLTNIDDEFLLSLKNDFDSNPSSALASSELLSTYSPMKALASELETAPRISQGNSCTCCFSPTQSTFCAFRHLTTIIHAHSLRSDQSKRLGSCLLVDQKLGCAAQAHKQRRSAQLGESQSKFIGHECGHVQSRDGRCAACTWPEIDAIYVSHLWPNYGVDGALATAR